MLQRRVDRNAWYRASVPGRSFMDVGGLWGVVNEQVTPAADAGAARMTMADIAPAEDELWTQFRARLDAERAARCRTVVADVTRDDFADRVERHDVVHCSGVLYHVPDPLRLIHNLRAATNETMIIASMVLPARLENEAGALEIAPGQALFLPSAGAGPRGVVSAHFTRGGIKGIGLSADDDARYVRDDGGFDYGPWWWLPTPDTMIDWIQVCGLHVLDCGWVWDRWVFGVLARKR